MYSEWSSVKQPHSQIKKASETTALNTFTPHVIYTSVYRAKVLNKSLMLTKTALVKNKTVIMWNIIVI